MSQKSLKKASSFLLSYQFSTAVYLANKNRIVVYMSHFGNDITEQYINKMYEDLQKEQLKLMNDLKTGTDGAKENTITKQISLINTINVALMRFRNLRKKSIE